MEDITHSIHDIITKELNKIKKEYISKTTEPLSSNNASEPNYLMLVKELVKEVDFLRQEIINKNKLLDLFMSKSMNHDDEKTLLQSDKVNFDNNLNNSYINSLPNESQIIYSNHDNSSHSIDDNSSTSFDNHDNSSDSIDDNSSTSFYSSSEMNDSTFNLNHTKMESVNKRVNQENITSRKKSYNKYVKDKNIFESSNVVIHKWPKGTTLVVGDSLLHGINEKRLQGKRKHLVKVRVFQGASVDCMYDYLKPLLRKEPSNILLHIGTNSCQNEKSKVVLNKILSLKHYIETVLPECKVIISKIIVRTDDPITQLIANNVNIYLESLDIPLVNNDNILPDFLSDGLHLRDIGIGKLAVNFIKIIRKIHGTKSQNDFNNLD